ncbi:MAG: GGDEF domain-containing protein [Bradyrhizobiaceae bacterium]|nr:MAG: GGDEF domain-containing protein [Bradyrhizobiaceae bacterium]
MSLEVNTLFRLTVNIEAMLGLLLLLAWIQNSRIRAVAWWSVAHLMRSASIALYGHYGTLPDLVSIDFANALLFSSFGVTWIGARVFNGREPLPGSLLAGAALWMLACQLPGFTGGWELRGLLSSAIIATYAWLAAYEFWRGRDVPLISRWPAILLFFIDGALFLLRSPLSAAWSAVPAEAALSSAWITVLSVEALLMTIATAFILLAMAKERNELPHKTAAQIDPLTGLFNRRAFLEQGEALRRRQVAAGRPVAILLVDLDHFKSINDRFGHQLGDRVLQVFARTARANLRMSDLVGRLGGEEFIVLVADAERSNAYLVADRIRTAFMADAAVVDGVRVQATLSAGVSVIVDPDQDLSALFTQADRALYRAKARGRNRVEVAGTEPPPARAAVPAASTPRAA